MEKFKRLYKMAISRVGSIPADKLLHFVAGMFITLLIAAIFPAFEHFAVIGAITAGVAKEVVDKLDYGRFNWIDLLVTAFGGAVVQALLWL